MTNAETTDKAANVAEQGAHVAPVKVSSKKGTSQKKGAPKAKMSAKAAPKKKASKPARAQKRATERSNKMKRAKGATLAEIMKATGWQRHTVRGFVSILGSKGGEKIDSSKNAAGERTYRIAK